MKEGRQRLSVTQSLGHDSFFAIVSMAMKGQQK
jgi:hypothetical protein